MGINHFVIYYKKLTRPMIKNLKFSKLKYIFLTFSLVCTTYISSKNNSKSPATADSGNISLISKNDSIKSKNDLKKSNREGSNHFIASAISEINAQTINQNSINQIEQALNGTLSGLYSLRNGGNKFGISNYNFYIRGKATTGDNSPLILVDGIDGNINLTDPREIESIVILKDASELSMYGLRGANGVILIQTKRGNNNKSFMQLDGQFGMQTPQAKARKLNASEYSTLHNEANINDGISPVYSPENYLNNSDIYRFPSTDLPGDFIKENSTYKQYNFTAGGGNNIARYFALLGYTRQDGLYELPVNNKKLNQTYNERYNFRTNLDVELGKGFKLNTNISAIFDDRRSPWISGNNVNNTNNFLWNSLYSTPANAYPLINPDGSLGGTSEYRDNPIGLLSSGLRVENTRQLTANIHLTKDLSSLIQGLSIRFQYGFENYNAYYKGNYTVFGVSQLKSDSTYALYGANDTKVTTTGGQMTDYFNDITFNSELKYIRSIGSHHIFASLNFNEYTSYNSGDVPPYKWLGTSSRILYHYLNKYIIQFSSAYQGSNNYASGKRFGFFPSGAFGWVVSEEDFLSKNNHLNYLKARLSFGKTANDKTGGSRFMHRQIYYNTGGYGFGNPNGTTQGSFEGTLGNPDASWEEAYKLNAGIDLRLFNEHLSVNADYFHENRNSILVNQSNITPALIGISLPQYNAGKIKNTGGELQLQYSESIGSFNIQLGGNLMYAKNTIVDLKEINYPISENYRYRQGNAINSLFGYVADGIYNDQESINQDNVLSSFGTLQPGDIKYKDLNNDGIINEADKKVIGNLFPEFIYGFQGSVTYNNFDFSFQTEGSELFDVHLRSDQFSKYAFENRWQNNESGSIAKYPRLSFVSDHNMQTSSYWLQKGSLFRLSALELGYTLPSAWVKSLSISGLRMYVKANNIFSTMNNREGRDLEASGAGFSQYPVMKTILVGLSVKL